MIPKASGDRMLGAVVASACVACCLPLVVAAGPPVLVAGAAVAGAGATIGAIKRLQRPSGLARPQVAVDTPTRPRP